MKAVHTKEADGSERIMLGAVIMAEKPARAKRRRKDWQFSIELLRMREIESLIRHRHGRCVPDPEDTDDRDTCLAYVRAAALALTGQDMVAWCRLWTPWVREADLLPILKDTATRRRMMRADGAAGLLNVTMAERTALGFKTIGACDMTKADRKKLTKAKKRERDRNRQDAIRRAAGCEDRKSQRARTLASLKPWEAEGISRATWFRRQRETPTSRVDIYTKGDERVSPAQSPVSSHVHGHVAGRVALGDRGSGTESPAGFQGAAPHGSCEDESPVPTDRRNAA
jgi:hypothetical protein